MIFLKLSELQDKDVININNGENLGKIIDADISDSGIINYFIVEKKRMIWQLFKNTTPDSKILFNKIKKIGSDVILVEL